MKNIILLTAAAILLGTAGIGTCFAGDRVKSWMNAPTDPLVMLSSQPTDRMAVEITSSFILFALYRQLIGPARGWRCPMSPSCSTYARHAFRKKGSFFGIMAAGDRLIRCGSDLHLYPPVWSSRGWSYADSLR